MSKRFPQLRHFHALVIVVAVVLAQSCAVAQSQIAPPATDPAAEPQREIPIAPHARDAEIAERLTRILDASGWFSPAVVAVREGIVFLDGQTETEAHKDWARQLALRTQGVVAVVNRIEVVPKISWDLTPTWREIDRLTSHVQWFAPLAVVSAVILLASWFVSRGLAVLARRALRHRIPSPLLLSFVVRLLTIPVILIGIYLVLQIAGLTRLAITVLGGTGLVGIVIGLAFREIAENSLASLLLSIRNPFRTGDWIRVGAHEGIVQSLNLRATVLLTLDGNHVQIPNALIFKSTITNFSTSPGRRAEFIVGVGYADSIARTQDIIIRALRAHPAVLEDPEPAALVEELAPSTVNIKAQFWVDGRSYSIFKVRSALIRQVKRALMDAGISMPDTAREIVFPDGVPIRRAAAAAPKADAERTSTPAPDGADAATVAAGEGDLGSEEEDLQSQAAAAELPAAEENLLTSTPGRRPGT